MNKKCKHYFRRVANSLCFRLDFSIKFVCFTFFVCIMAEIMQNPKLSLYILSFLR